MVSLLIGFNSPDSAIPYIALESIPRLTSKVVLRRLGMVFSAF